MATVNLTCAACEPSGPCPSCRAIAKALRSAGHSVTQSTRYAALRAATVGTYGFEACILPVAISERAIVDAAVALLNRTRVALVMDRDTRPHASLPEQFFIIEKADWRDQPFPTEWITSAPPKQADNDYETRTLEELGALPNEMASARRRLKSIASRAVREIGAAGFPADSALDLLAALEDEIAWANMSGSYFGLLLIHVGATGSGTTDTQPALSFLKKRAALAVRAGDLICQRSDSLLVILAETDPDETEVVAARIRKTLRKAAREGASDPALSPTLLHITFGMAAYPTHGTSRASLLARATASAETI